MNIWFWTWVYYLLFEKQENRHCEKFLKMYKTDNTNSIELMCLNEFVIDLVIEKNYDLNMYKYISVHWPWIKYRNDENTKKILEKIGQINEMYKLNNIVIHPDLVEDWTVFNDFRNLPISIENMDNNKDFWINIKDIKKILDKYDFRLTLDLQHCYTNDKSMELALEMQSIFRDRICEYHISWYGDKYSHGSLYKLNQDIIIKSLKFKDKPIIIESVFDKIGEHENEINYIHDKIVKYSSE